MIIPKEKKSFLIMSLCFCFLDKSMNKLPDIESLLLI
jgi:hypothetical protein